MKPWLAQPGFFVSAVEFCVCSLVQIDLPVPGFTLAFLLYLLLWLVRQIPVGCPQRVS